MAKLVKYTLDSGVTFSSASKVVSDKWATGDKMGAYESYLTRDILEPMKKIGMSKSLRASWLTSLAEGMRTKKEALDAIALYQKQVADNIAKNLENQYSSVLSQLKNSSDPALRKLADKIQDLIEEVSDWYHPGGATYLAKKIEELMNSEDGWDLTDKGLMEMETAMDYFVDLQEQKETAGKFKFVTGE